MVFRVAVQPRARLPGQLAGVSDPTGTDSGPPPTSTPAGPRHAKEVVGVQTSTRQSHKAADKIAISIPESQAVERIDSSIHHQARS